MVTRPRVALPIPSEVVEKGVATSCIGLAPDQIVPVDQHGQHKDDAEGLGADYTLRDGVKERDQRPETNCWDGQ